jgi:hypothetical protein
LPYVPLRKRGICAFPPALCGAPPPKDTSCKT